MQGVYRDAILNKVSGFTTDQRFRHILGQQRSTFSLLDAMETLFDLLTQEPEAAVRAVLGHHLFVFIHPYFDGNGRIGRFLMNTMLASGGYPWTVIRVEDRETYLRALDAASLEQKIEPFARFIAACVKAGSAGQAQA